ncbi:MAG: DASS family sodium-coupled anion symporter, partial [Planctomycetota bacterium]
TLVGRAIRRGLAALACVAIAALAAYSVGESYESLDKAQVRALFILVLAATLWVSDIVPAFAVGILVIALQIALLGKPGDGFATSPKDWEHFVAVLGHPLVWLFFGGFVLAAGMERCGLDRLIATGLLGRFGKKPAGVLFGVMAVTFVLSMFISNTATTAMMLAILAPLVAREDAKDRFATALLVGCAVAANLGGMGSLIGTPPNAIAVGALAEHGVTISFLEWMWLGLPPAFCSMVAAWGLLLWFFPSKQKEIDASHDLTAATGTSGSAASHTRPDWRRGVVSITLIATLVMWLTSQWHEIPTAAVAFLPIVVFTTTGVLSAADIRGLSYDVLFLLAGGLALGQMLAETGLSDWLVSLLPIESLGPLGAVAVLALATVTMSNVMSNTAAANVLVPIGVSAATGFESHAALAIAFGASAAMCLPVATPPNAMVFSTGRCRASDFIRIGIPLGLLTPALGIAWVRLVLGS